MDNTMLVIFRDLKLIQDFVDFMSAYFVTLLLRCTLISYGLTAIVLLIRGTVLKKTVFLKGIIWSVFLLLPFLGKLKAYYEVKSIAFPFALCQQVGITFVWFRVLFYAVIGIMLFRLIKAEKDMDKLLNKAFKYNIGTEQVWVIDLPISPCAFGLIKPKIMLPKQMTDELSEEELKTVVLHERTHIRLGHLWIFFLWGVMSAVFWLNPLISLSFRFLREDMEQICDHVTITASGKDPYDYGELILKNIITFRNKTMRIPAMFIGENGNKEIRARFIKINNYSPCNRNILMTMIFASCALMLGSFLLISKLSYPKYEILPDITITDEMGNVLADWEKVRDAGVVERSDDKFVVDAEKLRAILPKGFPRDKYVYFYYDIFMKIPGMGGGGYCAWLEDVPMQGEVEAVQGGHDLRDDIVIWLVKRL